MGKVRVQRASLAPRALVCALALLIGAGQGKVATLIALGAILLILLDVE